MLPSPGVVDHLGIEPSGDCAPPPFTVVIHITGVIPHPGSVFPDCHEERGWSNAPSRGGGGGRRTRTAVSGSSREVSCRLSPVTQTPQPSIYGRLPVVFSAFFTLSHHSFFFLASLSRHSRQ